MEQNKPEQIQNAAECRNWLPLPIPNPFKQDSRYSRRLAKTTHRDGNRKQIPHAVPFAIVQEILQHSLAFFTIGWRISRTGLCTLRRLLPLLRLHNACYIGKGGVNSSAPAASPIVRFLSPETQMVCNDMGRTRVSF